MKNKLRNKRYFLKQFFNLLRLLFNLLVDQIKDIIPIEISSSLK